MENKDQYQQLLDKVADIFVRKMAFMKSFHLEVVKYDAEKVEVRFDMNDDLVGNMLQGILHGGASFSVLDTIGGMIAIAATCAKEKALTLEEGLARVARAATVNLRIDYIKPGQGKYFIASAEIVRCGSRIIVVRSELRNDKNDLICMGTANYVVGH
jgi:uncharacterized protein (TIGR00369 family)